MVRRSQASRSLETDLRFASLASSAPLPSVKPEPDDDATPSSVNSPAAGAEKKLRPKIKPKTHRHLDPDGEPSSEEDVALNQAVDVDESEDEEISPDIRGDFIGWDGKEVSTSSLLTFSTSVERSSNHPFASRRFVSRTGPSQSALLLSVPSTISQLPPHPRRRR